MVEMPSTTVVSNQRNRAHVHSIVTSSHSEKSYHKRERKEFILVKGFLFYAREPNGKRKIEEVSQMLQDIKGKLNDIMEHPEQVQRREKGLSNDKNYISVSGLCELRKK